SEDPRPEQLPGLGFTVEWPAELADAGNAGRTPSSRGHPRREFLHGRYRIKSPIPETTRCPGGKFPYRLGPKTRTRLHRQHTIDTGRGKLTAYLNGRVVKR